METNIGTQPDQSSAMRHSAPAAGRRARFSARAHAFLIRYPRALPVMVFAFIVAITVVAVVSTEIEEKRRVEVEANANAVSIANALERRGAEFASLLEMSKILFSAMGPISQTRFGILVGEVARDMELRGARAFGWIEIVDGNSEKARPMARVAHLAPNRSYNTRRIGADLYTQPSFAPVLREAARTNVVTATGKWAVGSEERGVNSAFSMVLPVYAERTEGAVVQGDLTGFFYGNFAAQEFLQDSIAPLEKSHLKIGIYDRQVSPANLLAGSGPELDQALRKQQTIMLGNREWILVVETPFEGALTQFSIGLLLFGLTFACLLMLVAQWLANRAVEDQRRLAFLEEQHSIRNSLSRELNHRVKNTLASVLSILSLTRRRANNLDQFADSLEGRIRSLSSTHDLLAETEWGTTPIRSVIEAELAHFAEDGQSIVMDGPSLELAPGDALSFGLAIHELVTNASKFGALSVPEGRVEVTWELAEENGAESHIAIVEWIERGGPEVPPTRPRGFGSDLIERLVPAQLKQKVELDFLPGGVRCQFGVPVRRVSEFRLREKPLAP